MRAGSPTPGALTLALVSLSEVEFRLGDWQAAYSSAVEALRLAHSSGRGEEITHALGQLAFVEAGLGRERACQTHAGQALARAAHLASDSSTALARSALGLLELGLGRPDAAVAQLEPLTQRPPRGGNTWGADLAEALIRLGDHDRAADVLASLASHAEGFTTRCALERCRGLLATDDQFDTHFARALDGCSHVQEPFERARTELCLGQRLRQLGRRVAAREPLRAALGIFDRLGAAPWAKTAEHELGASRVRARRRLDETRDQLTAQEHQVALIVAEGATNPEAASRLCVTTKAIEHHLGRIYRKLGVRSRTELARRLTEDRVPGAVSPAVAAPPPDTRASQPAGEGRTRGPCRAGTPAHPFRDQAGTRSEGSP